MRTRAQKEALVQEIVDKLQQTRAVVFAGYKGIKVSETEELRRKLFESGAEIQVVKNTLLKIALEKVYKDSGKQFPEFAGQTAVAYGLKDEVSPARVLAQFGKDHPQLQILSGMLGSELIDKNGVMELATLPTKEQLLGRLLGSINAPVSNFVGVLRAEVASVVHVMNAIAKKKEGAAA